MKLNRGASPRLRPWTPAIAAAALSLLAAPLQAGSAVQGDPEPLGAGISYEWTVVLGANDTIDFSRWVGAWSWEDDSFSTPTNPQGWTHTSDFVALTLTEPQTLTIRLERFATPMPAGGTASIMSMNPSFTIWSGWDNTGAESHVYNNDRNISWAEVTYIGHVKNSTQPVAEATYILPAGNYTLALGSNAPADDGDDQGYKATFTTSVPEPGAATCLLAGAASLAVRRRRRSISSISAI